MVTISEHNLSVHKIQYNPPHKYKLYIGGPLDKSLRQFQMTILRAVPGEMCIRDRYIISAGTSCLSLLRFRN